MSDDRNRVIKLEEKAYDLEETVEKLLRRIRELEDSTGVEVCDSDKMQCELDDEESARAAERDEKQLKEARRRAKERRCGNGKNTNKWFKGDDDE